MLNYLYKHWAYICLPLALYSTLILFSSAHEISLVEMLIWLQFSVYLLHQFEEHAFPGGFKDFVNKRVFKVMDRDVPMDEAGVFWVNIPAIWLLFPIVAVLAQNYNLSIGVILPYFGLFNATLHILFLIKDRKYNPGVLVSIFLNYPTGIYTLVVMYHFHLLTLAANLYAFAISFLAHIAMIIYALVRYKLYKKASYGSD